VKMRNGAAVCGPYTDEQARHQAAEYYHGLPSAQVVSTTDTPELPAGDPDTDWVIKASHPDGRRALIGPFQMPDAIADAIHGFGAGLDDWQLQLDRLRLAA
jgi:hypothetical protein